MISTKRSQHTKFWTRNARGAAPAIAVLISVVIAMSSLLCRRVGASGGAWQSSRTTTAFQQRAKIPLGGSGGGGGRAAPTFQTTRSTIATCTLTSQQGVRLLSTMPFRDDGDDDYLDVDNTHFAQASYADYSNNNQASASARSSGTTRSVDWFEQYSNAGDDDQEDEYDLFPANNPPKPAPIPTTAMRNNQVKSSPPHPVLPRSSNMNLEPKISVNNIQPTASATTKSKPARVPAVVTADGAAVQPKPASASSYPKPASSASSSSSAASKQISKPATISVPETVAPVSSNDELLHPQQFLVRDETTGQLRLPHPKSLSPSSIKEFLACPQSFLFQYILGLRQPTNAALAKGSMCHAALERVFDLDPEQRDLTTLQNLFRAAWSEHRTKDAYKDLFGPNVEQEAAWGREGLQLLENYWRLEDAAQVSRPNPVQREVWVSAKLPLDPARGVTAAQRYSNNTVESTATQTDESFLVRGIIDRLDMVQSPDDKQVALRLIDYKSGKKPDLKYSPAMNAKIRDEALEQLLIYALLLRESGKKRENPMPLRYLRLLYLTSRDGTADVLDLDMGATADERDARLNAVHDKLARVWRDVVHLIDQVNANMDNVDGDSTASKDDRALLQVFVGCQRTFCYCHKCRTRFQPGTVWEPEDWKEFNNAQA